MDKETIERYWMFGSMGIEVYAPQRIRFKYVDCPIKVATWAERRRDYLQHKLFKKQRKINNIIRLGICALQGLGGCLLISLLGIPFDSGFLLGAVNGGLTFLIWIKTEDTRFIDLVKRRAKKRGQPILSKLKWILK